MRDALIPLATVATPNLFELSWLTQSSPRDPVDVLIAARGLGPATVAVTSAEETENDLMTLLVTATECYRREVPRRKGIPNGAGDLFAGLLLGNLLSGHELDSRRFDASLALLDRVLAASQGCAVLQLSALTGSR